MLRGTENGEEDRRGEVLRRFYTLVLLMRYDHPERRAETGMSVVEPIVVMLMDGCDEALMSAGKLNAVVQTADGMATDVELRVADCRAVASTVVYQPCAMKNYVLLRFAADEGRVTGSPFC